MKLLAVICLVSYAMAKGVPEGEDDLTNLNLDDFEDYFGLDHVTDPEEKKRREEALKENEEKVKEVNEAYEKGESSWWDEINEMADLPEDEFEAEHTGLVGDSERTYARGLIDSPMEYDEASERYFDTFRLSRATVPDAYSSVDEGHVTPVKNQRACGSCTAFANLAAVETCFARKLGGAQQTGDYSEQQFLDCGFNRTNIAWGCEGAALESYVKWFQQKNPELANEKGYPYTSGSTGTPTKDTHSDDTCQQYDPYFQGVSLTGGYWTRDADEDTMRKLVYEHGAVITSIDASQPWSQYKGGVFSGCDSDYRINHAVTVVGYGTQDGEDYWLVKNSWGDRWGDKGFIKMKRGVQMCGIGKKMVVWDCEKRDGTTNAPPTTTTTAAPNPAGCLKAEKSRICGGSKAGATKKVGSEQECAEYCWSLESCEAWTLNSKWNNCHVKTSANCTIASPSKWSWGSANCGAPAGCQIKKNTYLCAGNNVEDGSGRATWMESASHVKECSKLCAETSGCVAWTLSKSGWCYRKTSTSCQGSHSSWTTGTKECGL